MKREKITELKQLERLQKQIAKKKQRLEDQLKAEQQSAKWYDQVLKESAFKRPKDFVKALMAHFGIRTVTLSKTGRGPGRPAKAAGPKKARPAVKRKRVRVDAEVRDAVKEALAGGLSKNAAAKQFGISNPVIKKIADGAYDSL